MFLVISSSVAKPVVIVYFIFTKVFIFSGIFVQIDQHFVVRKPAFCRPLHIFTCNSSSKSLKSYSKLCNSYSKKSFRNIIISHQNIFGKNLTCILWCGTQKIVKFKRIFFEKCLRRKRFKLWENILLTQ